MAEFIKKNMVMVVILAVALGIAVIMALLDFDAYLKISGHMKSIEEGHGKIQRINRTGVVSPGEYKFNPELKTQVDGVSQTVSDDVQYENWDKQRKNTRIISGNAILIHQDAEDLKELTWRTQRTYGHFYDKAFEAFLRDLTLPTPKPPAAPPMPRVDEQKPESVPVKEEAAKKTEPQPAAAPAKAEAAKPETAKTEAAKPETAKAEAAKPEPAKTEAAKPETAKAAKPAEQPVTAQPMVALPSISKWSELDDELTREMEKLSLHGVVLMFQKNLTKDVKALKNISVEEEKALFGRIRSTLIKAPASIKGEDLATYEMMAALRFDRAFRVFREKVQPITAEDMLDEKNPGPAIAAFLQVLGIQRTMGGTDFSIYNEKLQERLFATDAIPLISAYKKNMIASIMMNLDLGKDQLSGKESLIQKIPPDENIPHIVRRFQIYEDLFGRMKKAKITTLISLKPSGKISGTLNGSYRTYTFDVTVRGTMPQIRALFNDMHQAYKENRVYALSGVSFELFRHKDDQTDTVTESDHPDVQKALNLRSAFCKPPDPKKSSDSQKSAKKDAPLLPAVELDPVDDPMYGMAFLGTNAYVVVSFTFSYVIYVGDLKAEDRQ